MPPLRTSLTLLSGIMGEVAQLEGFTIPQIKYTIRLEPPCRKKPRYSQIAKHNGQRANHSKNTDFPHIASRCIDIKIELLLARMTVNSGIHIWLSITMTEFWSENSQLNINRKIEWRDIKDTSYIEFTITSVRSLLLQLPPSSANDNQLELKSLQTITATAHQRSTCSNTADINAPSHKATYNSNDLYKILFWNRALTIF